MAQFFKATPTNSAKNRILKNVKIEKLDHQGRGLAYHQNKPLFIDGALNGELLDIQILESKKRYSKGQIKNIAKSSDLRVEPACPHYQQCGGCHLQHIQQETQIQIKSDGLVSLFKRFAKQAHEQLEKPIQDQAWGYRRTARLGLQFDRKSKHLKMGFRRSSTNDLIDQKVCPVLVPQLERLIQPLKSLLNNLKIKADLGHVELMLADQGAVILLRHMKPFTDNDLDLINAFSEKHQLNFFGQASSNQSICLSGQEKLTYQLPEWDCTLDFTPTDFLQVNAQVNQKMVAQALSWLALQKTDQVLDLFCGLGNFTLPIAKQVKSVIGVEGIQKMVDKATTNAHHNNINNAHFYQADLNSESLLKEEWAVKTFNKVLLDPARAGAQNCMAFITKMQPSHIVYVSCDPLTLARDSQILLEQGYTLSKLGLLDMFPQTSHMESMALFTRK
ncbi:MAG: 23S rRNA (uracil(1939)-C(5))-methyltransferase RlmD [Psychromonas sp.]